jgi:uncharacterized membrane protein
MPNDEESSQKRKQFMPLALAGRGDYKVALGLEGHAGCHCRRWPHLIAMRPRTFELRGLPAVLVLVVLGVVLVGAVALVLMVGAAVAVAGLGISAVAALYYTLRRKLSSGTKRSIWLEPEKPVTNESLVVRDIEVEVLPQKER